MLIIFGSLTTVDPGNIFETLSSCVKDRIRISLVALAAETKICRELCDKTGGASPSVPSRAILILRRYLRCRHERRPFQGPPLRTYPPSSTAAHRRGCRRQDERRPNDDGLPTAFAGHRARGAVCVPRGDARRGVSVPSLRCASLRRADRLRRLWAHDRLVSASRAQLSPPLPSQTVLSRVSRITVYSCNVCPLTPPLFFFFGAGRPWTA